MPASEPTSQPKGDPGGFGLSWYEAHAVASPPRPPLTAETDVDVCVVGGGLAGLTAARELARRGWSVVVLESKTVAWNASGRNLGFVLPGFAATAEALVERVGREHARQLWALSEVGAEYVRNTVRETAMPGADLVERGWLHVSKTDRAGAKAKRFDILTEVLGAAVEAWPVERVRQELRSRRYFEALYYPKGFSINPLNYALGLAALAEAAGVRIHEDTPALQIDPIGVRKRIIVKGARVRASQVVLAGNVHLAGLMPQFAATLLPTHRAVIATEPLGRALRELVRFEGAVSDTEHVDNHYRVLDGDRLLWSGRSTVWRGNPRRAATALLGDIAKAYPSLRGTKAEYAWTGTLGHTVHRMPQIGELSPGLWLMSGFGSQGLNTTAMAGELVARAIVEGDSSWRLFSPFGMVWAAGRLGRAAEQASAWRFRAGERLEGLLARRREARRGPVEPLSVAADLMEALPPAAPEVPAVPEPEVPTPEVLAPATEDVAAPAPLEAMPVAADAPPPRPRRKRGEKRKRANAAIAQETAPGGDPPDDDGTS